VSGKPLFLLRRPLWLASSSRYRRELLARLGLPFEHRSPDIDESRLPGEAPDALARRLARAKAEAIVRAVPEAWVIGSDQVCALGEQCLGKPGTPEGQRAMLARPDISAAIAAVRVPTLVAVGEHDRICLPSDARDLSDHIAGSHFHEIRNCGHLAPLERPGEVTQLLRDWLQS